LPVALFEPPPPARSPWQRLYGAVHALRRHWWRRRARRLPVPVVSIGNLHWGGSGKTPLVAALATHLRDRGLPIAILSRGYGRRDRNVRMVSTGEGPLLGPSVAGDEPVLLAGAVRGAGVVVGPDRWLAGRHALERLVPTPRVLVLDDGFSHLGLARDLDILVFPAADPFAGGRLWPSGRLREPLASARHADAAMLTGSDDPAGGRRLAEALRPWGFRGPGFTSALRVLPPRAATGEPLPRGARVLLVSGIARPERFAAAARTTGVAVRGEVVFADHHDYPPSSLARIVEAFRASGADWVLATAKDQVKLLGRVDVPLAELPIEAQPEPAFWRWLDEALAARPSR
jgi:tetraacyldisaccharide 4'-kinase